MFNAFLINSMKQYPKTYFSQLIPNSNLKNMKFSVIVLVLINSFLFLQTYESKFQ